MLVTATIKILLVQINTIAAILLFSVTSTATPNKALRNESQWIFQYILSWFVSLKSTLKIQVQHWWFHTLSCFCIHVDSPFQTCVYNVGQCIKGFNPNGVGGWISPHIFRWCSRLIVNTCNRPIHGKSNTWPMSSQSRRTVLLKRKENIWNREHNFVIEDPC